MDLRCATCNVLFSLPETLYKNRQRDGGTFYCPNGHAQCFRVTDTDKLRELNDKLNDKITRLERNCGNQFLLKFIKRICPDCRSDRLAPCSDGDFRCLNCKLVNPASKMKWKLRMNHKELNEYFNDKKEQ